MIIFFCCLFLLFTFLWPFCGGWREMRLKKDPLPLFINVNYLKEPRYFSLSFRGFFKDILSKKNLPDGTHEIKLSKPETVEVFAGGKLDSYGVENLFYVRKDLHSKARTEFAKEVYVLGQTIIGKENSLRALACDGEIQIGAGTHISRWLDAEGMIQAEEDCNLGISVTTAKELLIKRGCEFKRLYGAPVVVGQLKVEENFSLTGETTLFAATSDSKDIREVAEGSINNFSIITIHTLHIGSDSIINGHVKCYQSVTIGDNVLITGNVFSEGDIKIGENSTVLGNVFSQGQVILSKGSQVGQKGKVKSVIGNSSIVLSARAMVYGYVSTDGEGFVI